MQAKAVAKSVRIAPRKVGLVIDLIRGKNVQEAIAILQHTRRGASPVVEKVLKSAVANAEHNYEMDPDNLFVDRKSTRLNSSHVAISYAVFCLKKQKFYTAIFQDSYI